MCPPKTTNKSDDTTLSKRVRSRRSCIAGAASYALVGAVGAIAQAGAVAADNSHAIDPLGTPKREWALSVRWENDTFGGADKFYTDGIS